MNLLRIIFVCFLFICTQACKESSASSYSNFDDEESYTYEEEEEAYPDDTYCADVKYYNPDTGARSNFTLNVEVEDNEVTVIHFFTGWLDGSEFSSQDLDSNGYCSIRLYDGRKFEVQITGSECSYTDGYKIQNDIDDEIAEVTCPRCGSSKYSYDDYCDSCEDEIENTCSRCGGYEYYVNGGLCSDCKRDDEENDDW
ncbi:hypothetical protein NLM59_07600 [Weeksellaceae bacterium KMM 9724]|uniref:hypothetical protein n=1 Tax=Profundicola chukchiensis TaxID=2961959 RepID=UPI00244008F5|nr:hypothetical protein [Profundicola chukchiensis]MDG4950785.1 hypothetical protein [Profundicola chukchiensis]